MLDSLSDLVDNLAGGLQKEKFKKCKCSLEYITVKDDSLIIRCLNCNKNCEEEFDEGVKNNLLMDTDFVYVILINFNVTKSCLFLRIHG